VAKVARPDYGWPETVRPKAHVLARQTLPLPPAPDGLVDLPAGKIAAIATYLQMRAPPPGPIPPLPGPLERISGDLARYRALYARIGEPWLWFSRTLLSDERLQTIIGHPAVQPFALRIDGQDTGILELDFRVPGECELAFFGLIPEACRRGYGRALVGEAVRRAFAKPIGRLWLHTCTLDDPAAMPFYLKAGFQPYRRAVEIADDPRLAGYMPEDAALHFPPV